MPVADVASEVRKRPVVLFGAGGLGRQVLGTLRKAGVEPAAFADNNSAMWGASTDGVPVLSPTDAAQRYGGIGLFVTTTWRPAVSGGLADLAAQLHGLGCAEVVAFPRVQWALAGADFKPHYLWDMPARMEAEREAIVEASTLFSGADLELFWRQIQFRETADPGVLPPIELAHPQYFPPFLPPGASEIFVDCGAFDGDTIRAFRNWSGDRFDRIVAFEADPANFMKLSDSVAGDPRIDCRAQAVSDHTGDLCFAADGHAGASISVAGGGVTVPCTSLDVALAGIHPTFIKMDIEGSETDALQGARKTIQRSQPVLAICVYHRQSDLWRLPLLMRELLPQSRMFLRSYFLDGLDTVCYAVPASPS